MVHLVILHEMMKQMTQLNEKLNTLVKRSVDPTGSRVDLDEELEEDPGGLVQLTETMRTFLKAAFSGILTNTDRKK